MPVVEEFCSQVGWAKLGRRSVLTGKCGIAMALDGCEDSEINISELEEYAVEDEDDDEYTDDEDPFADCD